MPGQAMDHQVGTQPRYRRNILQQQAAYVDVVEASTIRLVLECVDTAVVIDWREMR